MAPIAPSHPLARIAVVPASLPCDEHAPPERAATSDRGGDWRLHLLAVLLVSTVYVGWHLGRGWVAHDDGALAQSAMRLLAGELPHRDFDELYSGGLTFLNAAMFRLLGATLFTMRVPLLLAFLASLPAIFYIATRFVRPAAATAITLLCVVWTLPNYPAPLPSWYNLFLAVAGIAAVFRWLETERSRWLVVAGIAGGLSLLVKVVGLYFIAGALLHLVYEAHRRSLAGGAGVSKHRAWGYTLFVSGALALFNLALLGVVRRQLYVGEFIQFVVPGALVTGFLFWNEWSEPAGSSAARFAVLARLIGPFAIGLIIPVALFLIPFIRGGAVSALITGVFILPVKRFGFASVPMLGPSSALALLPPILLFAARRHLAGGAARYRAAAFACGLAAYLLATATVPVLYRAVWFAARWSPPLLVASGVYLLLVRTRDAEASDVITRSRTVLLLCVASVFTLVQFPFSVPIYFCYAAPLVILVALALSRFDRLAVPAFYGTAIAFLALFAILRVNTSSLYGMGLSYLPYSRVASIGPRGGGVRAPEREADMYRVVTRVLQSHARGEYTWASPDCPEIYFLSGLKNPTRTLFDFFDEEDGRTARVLAMLEQHRITAIALNSNPNFTNGIRADLVNALETRYPYATNIGKFQVRWQ